MDPIILQETCGRPFYKCLADAPDNPSALVDWVVGVHASTGIGLTGFGFFFILTVGVGLYNWSEGFVVPTVWVTLMSGVLVTMVPGPVIGRIFGLIVGGVALLFVGLVYYLR